MILSLFNFFFLSFFLSFSASVSSCVFVSAFGIFEKTYQEYDLASIFLPLPVLISSVLSKRENTQILFLMSSNFLQINCAVKEEENHHPFPPIINFPDF